MVELIAKRSLQSIGVKDLGESGRSIVNEKTSKDAVCDCGGYCDCGFAAEPKGGTLADAAETVAVELRGFARDFVKTFTPSDLERLAERLDAARLAASGTGEGK